jgi:hypothetical protein
VRSVIALAQKVLMYDRMLFGDSFVWKCVILSLCLHLGGLVIVAIVGSMRWYRRRRLDVGFELMSNRVFIDVCSNMGSTSILD